MTTMKKLYELVMKIKAGKISAEKLKPEALLKEDLGFDSLDMTELLVLSEDAFGLEIDPEDARKQKTLQAVADYLNMRLAG